MNVSHLPAALAPRSSTPAAVSVSGRAALAGSALAVAAFLVHVVVAPLRRLTFDEAYYACGAARGVPWPIPHHPPMLGVLLRAVPATRGVPVELRVRVVAAVLAAVTALGVGRLAALVAAPRRSGASFVLGVALASFGLMPFASGLQAVPEVPALAAVAWLFSVAASHARAGGLRREIAAPALALLSACAFASKVSAILCIAPVALALLRRRAFSAAVATALGVVAALPVALPSLLGQSAHALGRGPWLTQDRTGAAGSLAALAVAVGAAFGPGALVRGARSTALRRIPGGPLAAGLVVLALVASAVASGRLPEVHWFAPASVPLYAAAAAGLADERVALRRRAVSAHVAPALAALVVWCVPNRALERHSDFFAQAQHAVWSPNDAALSWTRRAEEARFIPRYGMSSWRCVYAGECGDLDRVLRGEP